MATHVTSTTGLTMDSSDAGEIVNRISQTTTPPRTLSL